eukprot:c29325_g1_i1 orf=3-170(-)
MLTLMSNPYTLYACRKKTYIEGIPQHVNTHSDHALNTSILYPNPHLPQRQKLTCKS